MRILYLEDEGPDAELVERYVQITPHQIDIAKTIQEATLMLEKSPDLILVDIFLNHSRDGYEFVSKLRSQGYDRPIVAVTGMALPSDVEQCYQAGVNDILKKPYSVTELVAMLNQYLI